MALAAVGHHRLLGGLTAGHMFIASEKFGKGLKFVQRKFAGRPPRQQESSPSNKEHLVTSIAKVRGSNT
jgi:hypothetical protein